MLTHYIDRIREEPLKVRFLLSRILWHARLFNLVPMHVEAPGTTRVRIRPTAMGANLWMNPLSYEKTTSLILRCLRPGDVFVDVGANIGLHTVAAGLRVASSGRVIAIEPHPRTFKFLLENIAVNDIGWVETHQVAASEKRGQAFMANSKSDDQNRLTRKRTGTRVATVPIDDLVPPGLDPDLLKVDVEGYEELALIGAEETLRRTSCVHFEVWDGFPQRFGLRLEGAFDLLLDAGFHIFHVPDEDVLVPASRSLEGMHGDLLAVRNVETFLERTRFRLESERS